ncbi:MAG: hypothetical protein ACE5FH_00450 [Candidatus Zixiibacteriota bacterium]
MRKLIILMLVMAIAAPSIHARKKRPKAGTVKDKVYTDSKHEFKLTLNPNWKYSIGKAKAHYRITLVQKAYEIPPKYMTAPNYTQIPRLVLYVDTCSLGAKAVVDSLMSPTYKSDQKSRMLREFEILLDGQMGTGFYRYKVVPRKNRILSIADQKAFLWIGKSRYTAEVTESSSSSTGKRVEGNYGGAIVAIKKGNLLLLFHVLCEYEYFPSVYKEAMEMIESVEFLKEG